MAEKPDKKFRQLRGPAIEDQASIDTIKYNEAAGADKNLSVGGFYEPLNLNATTFTTDATTSRKIRSGTSIAIYNNSSTLYSVTISETSIAALAPGAVDPNGNVGVPCKPNDWTLVNMAEKNYLITNNVALLVFKIKDETYITSQKQG